MRTATMMTFEQFQASGRDVDDIGLILQDDGLMGVNGRMYCKDTLWMVPCVTSGVGWSTVIGNQEYQSARIEVIERKLYEFAVDEGLDCRPRATLRHVGNGLWEVRDASGAVVQVVPTYTYATALRAILDEGKEL